MANFSHLKQREVKLENVSDYPLYDLDGKPVLELAPATEVNKKYFNKLLKHSNSMGKAVQAGGLTTAMLNETRELDKELFPGLVIIGWRNMYDADNNLVEFSSDECRQFLEQLPNWIFDGVRAFARVSSNFAEQIDTDKTGKN